MAALFFYSIVATVGIVFLLAVAHDELTGITHKIVDLLH
jgi:hypothetical protein